MDIEQERMKYLFNLVEASNGEREMTSVEVNGFTFTFPANHLHWPVAFGMLMEQGRSLGAMEVLLGDQWVDAGVDDWPMADGYRLIGMIFEAAQT